MLSCSSTSLHNTLLPYLHCKSKLSQLVLFPHHLLPHPAVTLAEKNNSIFSFGAYTSIQCRVERIVLSASLFPKSFKARKRLENGYLQRYIKTLTLIYDTSRHTRNEDNPLQMCFSSGLESLDMCHICNSSQISHALNNPIFHVTRSSNTNQTLQSMSTI